MKYIVYKTTNFLNGRFYVGVHNSKSNRYLGSGPLLKAAIKKYGKSNFIRETLVECVDAEEAYSIEAMLVKTVKEDPRSYNLEPGGFGNINLGKYVVDRKIGIHAATFEERSKWQQERIANTSIEKLKEHSSHGGKRCAELGKSGFQIATHEQRMLNSAKAEATKKALGIKSTFCDPEVQRRNGAKGGKVHLGSKTYNDGTKEFKFFPSNKLDKELIETEFANFISNNPKFKPGRIYRPRNH